MILLDIQYDLHIRIKGEETVGIFTGFRYEYFRTAYADVPADRIQNTAYRHRRVGSRRHQDLRHHRGCRRLSVGPRDADGIPVIPHQLPQKFRPAKQRNSPSDRLGKLRVVGMNGGRVDNHADSVRDIFRFLADRHPCAFSPQPLGKFGLMRVRSGNRKSPFHENFRQSAHADAADSDEMHMFRPVKIDLIHVVPFFA